MYPVLILRSELVCLILLIFLFFTSRSYKINSKNSAFGRILCFAIIHVVFDIITVITVNHTEAVPSWLNWLCHTVFYLSAILFSNEIVNYVIAICYPRRARRLYALGHILTLLYLCCLSVLKITYVPDLGTYSSAGPAAIVGYGLAFSFFIGALVLVFTHMKKMSVSIKNALIPMMLVLMITEICQVIWRSVLFTGGAVTIVTVGFFFSLENPAAVFKKKAMTDALTGVHSRSSYEEDIEKYDRRFRAAPNTDYIFVFCDLNDLRSVNNRFGHAEGDNYITLIASAINSCMKHATSVYRIGGDEFLILYYRTDEKTVEQEIATLQDACRKASEGLNYTAAVTAGYARSSDTYRSLRDVVKTADYAMYRNKTSAKRGNSYTSGSLGTTLNYAGLIDKMFDALCASNEKIYPFITNLDTNVTRIASAWKDYFGLEDEFFADFNGVWKDRVHPDYLQGYMADIIAVINGHQKYHNFEYFAKKADGEYVRVSCHGAMYLDSTSGSSYFTGFMINHGLEDNIDPATGFKNFDLLTDCVSTHMDQKKPFSVLKLRVNNLARVNMLYGYNVGNELIREIAGLLHRELGDLGEVYSHGPASFSILFETCDADILKEYYRKVHGLCALGLEVQTGRVPVHISGGAITNEGERREIERLRGGLVFALEESQNSQRNDLVFYNEAGESNVAMDIPLLSRIHADALAGMKYFKLVYQPIVDIASGKTVGAEALLRWIHPAYGEITPEKFIDFIENDPCYYRLGLSILEQAIKDAKTIREIVPDFKVNVNITALQLQDEDFANNVFEVLNRYDYSPKGLVLELTERCKEMDSHFLAEKIAELRSLDIQVAFDDLGTGYSTISLLMDIPVDEIKLDRNFVSDIHDRENYQLFVRALVLGSSSYGNSYNICFEGIENEDMLRRVSRFGNFLVQGYYFAKPLHIDDFMVYIHKELQALPEA